MKRLFFTGLFVNLCVMVINFATGVISARFLGPEGRGELAIVNQWTFLFIGLFAAGLPGALLYLGKTHTEKRENYFGSYLILGFMIGILGTVIGLLAIPYLLSNHDREVVRLTQLSFLALPISVLADGLIGTLQSLNLFRNVMLLRLLNPLGALILAGILIAAGAYTVHNFVLVSIGWTTFLLIVVFLRILRVLKPSFGNLFIRMRELMTKGIQVLGTTFVSIFGGNLDQIVISLLLTPYVLGLYTVAQSIGIIIPSIIIGSLNVYFWSRLMDLDGEVRLREVEKTHGTLLYASLFLCTIASVMIPFVLPFVYGHEFISSVPMAVILLLIAPLRIAQNILASFLSTQGKFNHVTIAEASGLGAGIAVLFVLLPLVGEMGAPLGVVAATLVKWAYMVYISTKQGIQLRGLLKTSPELFVSLLRRKRKAGSPEVLT